MSSRLSVLRRPWLVETPLHNGQILHTLRRNEFDARFPGWLDSVLANRPD
ncbi:hypothetical protein ACFOKI_03250 [Sphingomonas qilianensis]|uniref:Uncharacterized protein n=1 Tax=Sphingomonas qilianensis TaxID=1736690 RepID=A0ABU9XVB0_9SPHN